MVDELSPDALWRGYVVCGCAFVMNVFVMGVSNNFGIMLPTFLEEFQAGRTLTALVGSLQFSLTFALGPMAGALIDRFGCRAVSVAGGFLFSVGLMFASFAGTIYLLIPTYSLIFGVASCLLYNSYLVAAARCLPSKHQTFTMGVVTCGGAFGLLTFAPLLTFLIQNYKWKTAFRILSYLGVVICLLSLSFGWIKEDYGTSNGCLDNDDNDVPKDKPPFLDFSTCRMPRFFLFLCGTGISMLGYDVGIFFMADRAKTYGIWENRSKWFYVSLGVTGVLFRLLCGKVGDAMRHRVFLNLLSLFLHGINTLLSILCQTYITLLVYSGITGIFVGAYNALICSAVVDCVGPRKLAQAFGFLNFSTGVCMLLGAPLAGILKDKTGTFKIPLIIAGCLTIAGALVALPAAFITKESKKEKLISRKETNTAV